MVRVTNTAHLARRRELLLQLACLLGTDSVPALAAAASNNVAASPARAGKAHALVVGCGRYASLPASRQLPGAEADARLWARLLAEHHGEGLALQVLSSADSAQPPTHRNIMQGLDRLLDQARAGDTVWICLAGHGTQAPQRDSSRHVEADGLDELFLPMDCGRWMERPGEVARAIRDDEVHDRLSALQARGAHVLALFDTCHAAGMDRAPADRLPASRERAVSLSELGGPTALKPSSRAPQPREAAPGRRPGRDLRQLTLLYACRKHERTREGWVRDARGRRLQHGFFSWHLAQAWSELRHAGAGFELANLQNAVQQRYRQDDIIGAVPQLLGAPLPQAASR